MRKIALITAFASLTLGCSRHQPDIDLSAPPWESVTGDGAAGDSSGAVAPNGLPSVFAVGINLRPDYPPSLAVDGDRGTFITTNTLRTGDTKSIIFGLPDQTDLAGIEIIDDYTNAYSLGDLTVLVSANSTDGLDGTWHAVADITASNNPMSLGDGIIEFSAFGVRWVKLYVRYMGTGAHGMSPAFYLSEVRFIEAE